MTDSRERRLSRTTRKAQLAWDRLRAAEADLDRAWAAASDEERRRVLQELGIEVMPRSAREFFLDMGA